MKIIKEIYNELIQASRNQNKYATVYMLGAKDGVISCAIRINHNKNMGGCPNMIRISAEEMINNYLTMAKKGYTPIGQAHCNKYDVSRFLYWKSSWNEGEIVLTVIDGVCTLGIIPEEMNKRYVYPDTKKLEVV